MTLPTGATLNIGYGILPSSCAERANSTVSRLAASATLDPIGGGSFTTNWYYANDSNCNVTLTTESRADGSKKVVEWNTSGSFIHLRSKEHMYDTDGYTELQEVQTAWSQYSNGVGTGLVTVKDVPSGTWTKSIRYFDDYGREVYAVGYDYRSAVNSTKRTGGVRRWFDIDTSLWRTRLLREDHFRHDTDIWQTEYTTSSVEYQYDQFALTDRGTVTPQAPGYGTVNTNRNNITTKRIYYVLQDRFLDTKIWYDTVGNPVQTQDSLNRTSTLSYSATYEYAYPTSTTNPLSQTTSTVYNFNTGLPTSATDANGQTTTFLYDDYNRSLQTNLPDGGWVQKYYKDDYFASKYRTYVRTRHRLSSSIPGVYFQSWVYFDGLGRPIRHQNIETASAPYTYIFVDKDYALCGCTGRSSKTSLPYRTGETPVWVTRQYDGLGRIKKLIPPDGSSLVNYTEYLYGFTNESFSSPRYRSEGVFDAKGVGTVYRYDGSGALRRVGEDADYNLGSSTWTDYITYPDTGYLQKSESWWGQTITVRHAKYMYSKSTQGGQTRISKVDSLRRLVREEHPEQSNGSTSWPTLYAYDDGGRMTSKTDPRGVVTSMTYDALNRPLTASYSDGTPTVTWAYDQGIYGIGRLYSVSNAYATTSTKPPSAPWPRWNTATEPSPPAPTTRAGS